MFDIGFSEIILVLVIALIVVGPERLPRLARTTGLWIGKIRGLVASVKAEIDHELAAEELRKTLAKQASIQGLEEIIETTSSHTSGNKPADTMTPAGTRVVAEPGDGHGEPLTTSDKTASRDVMDDNKP
jgi:sec-independent protein translocase protein TatB